MNRMPFAWMLLAATLGVPLQAGEEKPEASPKAAEVKEQAYLGIGLSDIDEEDRADHGLKEGQAGLFVREVNEGGPAGKGGLKTGDILTLIDGTPVSAQKDMRKRIQGLRPGGEAKLTILRDGKEQVLTVVPGNATKLRQEQQAQMKQQQEQSEKMEAMLPPEMREKLKALREKVKVVENKSKALSEKREILRKQYTDQGLSEEAAEARAEKDLEPEIAELQKLQEEMQSAVGPLQSGEPGSP